MLIQDFGKQISACTQDSRAINRKLESYIQYTEYNIQMGRGARPERRATGIVLWMDYGLLHMWDLQYSIQKEPGP